MTFYKSGMGPHPCPPNVVTEHILGVYRPSRILGSTASAFGENFERFESDFKEPPYSFEQDPSQKVSQAVGTQPGLTAKELLQTLANPASEIGLSTYLSTLPSPPDEQKTKNKKLHH